jgi:hypothetical protein
MSVGQTFPKHLFAVQLVVGVAAPRMLGISTIAGLRRGIVGMRVGGVRNITISPHVPFGADEVPGKVPGFVEGTGSRGQEAQGLSVFDPEEVVRNRPR